MPLYKRGFLDIVTTWHEVSSLRPIFLFGMKVVGTTVPQTQKTWVFCITPLKAKQKCYDLQITTYKPLVLIIFQFIEECFHIHIRLLHLNRMCDWKRCKLISVV